MYKSKLQELCQKRSWELPEYTTVRDGPHHMPRFTATVNVNGQAFETPAGCKSSKEAQNTAARIAFEHFNVAPPAPTNVFPPRIDAPPAVNSQIHGVCAAVSIPVTTPVAPPPQMQPAAAVSPILPLSPLPSSLPNPPPGLLAIHSDANTKPPTTEVLQEKCEDTQTSIVNMIATGSKDKGYKDILHIYKNELQQYAQKESLGCPVYSTEAEGPPHARRFKSKVSVGGKSFSSVEFFPTLKEAEQAAAKVACQALSVDVVQEGGGMYKNLLQQLAQKNGLLCPSYETVTSGVPHQPTFMSTVTVGTDTYRGAEAKTKKLAEMNAAKVAYCTLTKGYAAKESSQVSSINECHVANVLSTNIQGTTTIKKHHDAENEVHPDAKRAKSSSENGNGDGDGHLGQKDNPPSEGSGLCAERRQWKTVVFPCKSNIPIPQDANMKPYCDDQWTCYKAGSENHSAA